MTSRRIDNQRSRRICYVMTHAMSTGFLRGQLSFLRQRGYRITLVTSPDQQLEQTARTEGVEARPVGMQREIRPLADLASLLRLTALFLKQKPGIVNAGTPKAGLLGMVAAWLSRVPVRVYTLHGLRLETTTGLKRRILLLSERLASACATQVTCVSQSLRQAYLELGIAPPEKLALLGQGSCNGIDTQHYRPASEHDRLQAAEVRTRHGVPAEAPLLLFVGRLTRDKGLPELVEAFQQVRQRFEACHLMLVGDFEVGDPLPEECFQAIQDHPAIHLVGHVDDPRPYYWASDFLVHPSLREGFPYAPLEAAACGKAVVGCSVTGVRDVVVDGETGQLTQPCDSHSFAAAVLAYLEDPGMVERHGVSARRRVVAEFAQESVWRLLEANYAKLCGRPAEDCLPPRTAAAA